LPREFKRTDRVGSQIQRELAELVRSGLDDPRLGMITIQEVRVVRDFSHAKVFFTCMAGQLDTREYGGAARHQRIYPHPERSRPFLPS